MLPTSVHISASLCHLTSTLRSLFSKNSHYKIKEETFCSFFFQKNNTWQSLIMLFKETITTNDRHESLNISYAIFLYGTSSANQSNQ